MDVLRTKAIQNFALSLIRKGGKSVSFINPVFKAPILIRNGGLTSEEYKAKTVCKYLVHK